jgi:hypothetical protein
MPQQEIPLLSDPKFWLSAFSLLVAALSAFNSWHSRRIATRALAISEGQEERRHPQLGIYLFKGYRRSVAKGQLFGFLVSVSNPTDINNSVAKAELQVTYVLEGDINAVCRIPHNPDLGETENGPQTRGATVFSLPARIDAHQTLSGWLLFALDSVLIGGKTIDSHRIILEDSHGIRAETEPMIITDWMHEGPTN